MRELIAQVKLRVGQQMHHLRESGQCGAGMPLDVFNGGGKDGMTRLAPKTNATGQLWRFAPAGGGFYRLTTKFKGTDLCLDVINGGPLLRQWVDDAAATPAELDALTRADEQAWRAARTPFMIYE